MAKRAALPLVALAFAAGCTATSPAGAPAPPSGPPALSAPAPAAPSGPPSGPASAAEPGSLPTEPAAWLTLVEDCPNEGQKPVVQGVLIADATGDGSADAIVSRSCEASTSYFPSAVEVFDSPEKPVGVLLKDAWVADNPWLTDVRVSDGVVIVKAHGSSGKQGNACADLDLTYRYRWTGSAFEQVDRKAVEAEDCLPVG